MCCQFLQSKEERATKSTSRSSKSGRYTTVGAGAGSISRRPCSQSKGQIIDRHAATLGSPIRSISPTSRDGTVQFRRRLGTATFHVRLVDRIGLSPDQFARANHHARSSREANAVKGARLVDRGFAQHVRAIHPFAACRYLQRYRSRRFRASSRAFIEASAQPPQPFGNPRRLDRPISQHDAGLRLSLHPEGLNGNAEIKGS